MQVWLPGTHTDSHSNHTRALLPEWQVAKQEEAKERKRMAALRLEMLTEACCWPGPTTKQKH